jgi:hypothetical protein
MKTKQILNGVVLMTMILVAGQAFAEDLKGTPGYVDLEWIQIPADAEEIQDIDLGVVLLSIAADAEENRDEALLQALSMIKSIRVKSWSMDEDDSVALKAVEKVTKKLADDDWKRLIYMKDDDETVTVSTHYVDGNMVGLMLVTYEPGDMVTFVNVVGDLDLGTLFKLVKQFDEDSIEDMLEELEGVEGVEINHH